MKRLGELIRKWRRASDRTQESLAAEIGISRATLCRIEQGEPPDGMTLKRIICWLLEE